LTAANDHPPSHDPPCRLDDANENACTYQRQVPFNLTGQPALAIQCGFSDDGLPIGLQVIGHAFDETTVYGARSRRARARRIARRSDARAGNVVARRAQRLAARVT